MAQQVIVFGATGYTGELVARALVARGLRPVLAGRSEDKLRHLASALGGLATRVVDVARPDTVSALVAAGDVLISTVGPFVRWGEPAVRAAIAAGATYFDSTGEPAFIRRVFEQFGPEATSAGAALLTACGFDWVPGNLAAALALRDAGARSTRVEVGYFSRGSGISGGTRASIIGAAIEPSFAFRDGALLSERSAARARSFDVTGRSYGGVAVGGSEHFGLPASFPALREVGVYMGMPNAERMVAGSAVADALTRLPGLRSLARSLADRYVHGSSGGPDAAARARGTSTVVAEAFALSGERLARVQLDGPDGYTFTAEFLAWAAATALSGGVQGVGALGPVAAFGLERLEGGAREAGFRRVE